MSKLYITTKFGQAPNHLLNDPSLSFKAKGLFTYMQSKPEGWDFSIERIKAQTQEGKSAIQSAVWELENAGYLVRKPAKDEQGRWTGYDYYLFLEPQEKESKTGENPMVGNKSTGDQSTETTVTISKKEDSKKEVVKKSVYKGKKINELIKMFLEINPTLKYQNKTERKKLQELIDIYSEETVEYMVRASIDCHGKQYAPIITKPTELYAKLSKLRAYLLRQKQEKEKNSVLILEEVK